MSGGELVPAQAAPIANPMTGEALELTASEEDLAAAIDAAKEMEGRLREFKSAISDELLRRMDHEAKWTIRPGRYKVEGSAPPAPDYDAEKLLPVLTRLVREKLITPGAAHDALERPKAPLKVKRRGINALLKLGGEVAAALAECQVEVTKPRSVSVKIERPS